MSLPSANGLRIGGPKLVGERSDQSAARRRPTTAVRLAPMGLGLSALFVAFWLQLDNPFWAGTSAAIVCQPYLGASLRKSRYRLIGTVVGAVTIVVLTAWFLRTAPLFRWAGAVVRDVRFRCDPVPQLRVLRGFVAGYTAAIIAADTLGATGGASSEVFMLAVTRASEICIGIVCAGVVLAGSDFGGAPRRLAALFAVTSAEIADSIRVNISTRRISIIRHGAAGST